MSQTDEEVAQAPIDRESRARWLSSSVRMAPRGFSEACGRDGCSNRVARPFDLFCTSTEGNGALHLLPLASNRRTQTIAAYAVRAVFALLPLVAATSRSPVPLYAGAAIAGLLILGLPLRHFPIAGVLAPVLWICAIVLAALIREGRLDATLTGDVELGLALLALAVLLGMAFTRSEDDGSQDLAVRGMCTGLALTLVSAALCAASALGFADTIASASHVLLIVCISAAGGVCSTAIIAGLLRGIGHVRHDREFTEPRRLEPKLLRKPTPPRPGGSDALSRLGFRLLWTAAAIAAAVANAVNSTIDLLYLALNRAVLWAALSVHCCKLFAVWIAKLLAETARQAVRSICTAAGILWGALRHWTQTTALGLALYAAAAAAAVNACTLFRSYLNGAGLPNAILSILLTLLATIALTAIGWALTRHPARTVAASALHNAEGAGAAVFLSLVALGWIDGIVGMLGYGPMRPGWLTISGTVVVVIGLIVAYRNGRGDDDERLPAAEHETPA